MKNRRQKYILDLFDYFSIYFEHNVIYLSPFNLLGGKTHKLALRVARFSFRVNLFKVNTCFPVHLLHNYMLINSKDAVHCKRDDGIIKITQANIFEMFIFFNL